MEIGKWCNSGCETIQLGRSHRQNGCNDAKPKWQIFWRRIKREKRKMLLSCSSVHFQASYDHDSYVQNFDQGLGWTEPDNLSRSFSARFADPSRTLKKNELLLD